jgi:hypothetical protein
MVLTYSSFQTFPLQIVGITSDYNAKIQAIENFVIADLAYSGEASDISAILPYFVFWFFCQDTQTTVFVETGENSQVKEFSTPEIFKQVQAWNIGVDKLRTVLEATGKTINEKYLSKRSLL